MTNNCQNQSSLLATPPLSVFLNLLLHSFITTFMVIHALTQFLYLVIFMFLSGSQSTFLTNS